MLCEPKITPSSRMPNIPFSPRLLLRLRVFWDVTLYSLAENHKRFGGTHFLQKTAITTITTTFLFRNGDDPLI
jgi:hypothetical protein